VAQWSCARLARYLAAGSARGGGAGRPLHVARDLARRALLPWPPGHGRSRSAALTEIRSIFRICADRFAPICELCVSDRNTRARYLRAVSTACWAHRTLPRHRHPGAACERSEQAGTGRDPRHVAACSRSDSEHGGSAPALQEDDPGCSLCRAWVPAWSRSGLSGPRGAGMTKSKRIAICWRQADGAFAWSRLVSTGKPL
jgi:hypothetical protein